MSDNFNELGELIDKLDNYAHALNCPMPPAFHVERFKEAMPELVKEFKAAFVKVAGENPWED